MRFRIFLVKYSEDLILYFEEDWPRLYFIKLFLLIQSNFQWNSSLYNKKNKDRVLLFYFVKYYWIGKRGHWHILQDLNTELRHMKVDVYCELDT